MEDDYLLEVRKIISKDDDSRIDMSIYKTAALITMVKNCDKKCPKCKEENVNCITKQSPAWAATTSSFFLSLV